MLEYLSIIWRWLIDVRSPRTVQSLSRDPSPRPIRVTNFVYPTVIVGPTHPHYWSRDALERSTDLDSTKPTGELALWLKAIAEKKS